MRKQSHPLLRGSRRSGESKYSHTFTKSEMQSLSTLCESILPPLPLNSLEGEEDQPSKALQFFCKASGSQTPIPDQVAELLVKRALKEVLLLVRVVLWLLATRLGTFLLCGSLCFCEKWPFIHSFSGISMEKREKVLQKWSRNRFLSPVRGAFVFIKVLCLFVFFSQGRLKLCVMDRRHDEEENMVAVYEASLNGCVSTLNTLIQRDPLILNKVSLTSLSETPLHIAALLGHLEFSRVLVSKKPKLAKEVDLLGRTPLHLASVEGYTEIVQALLEANTDVCLARDQDGRIPLHLAVMRGRIEIIEQLITARRESILVNLDGGSVLHLCVRYNHLDALKLLVVLANGEELFLNSKDRDGNSILHLAVMLKQMKVVKYLLSVPKIKKEANAMNMIGYTALDILEVYPKDFKCFEIQNILKEAGVKRSINLNSSLPPAPSGIGVDQAQLVQLGQPAQSRFRRCWECVRSSLVKHLTHQGNWIQESRGTLMVVATVIATMAFQSAINPPGGIWQEDTTTSANGFICTQDHICEAGTAVLAYSKSGDYQSFLSYNTASFFASVCVILLVISGFPLTSKFFIWFLTLIMAISVSFMTLTYTRAVVMVIPSDMLARFGSFGNAFVSIWYVVLVIVGVIHIILPLSSMVKKLRNFIRKSITG